MSEKLTVKIGSEEYPLALTIGAMMDFEEKSGRNVLNLLSTGMGAAATVPPALLMEVDATAMAEADASGKDVDEERLGKITEAANAKAKSLRGSQLARAVIDAVDLSMENFATLLWACVGGGEEGSKITPRQIAGGIGPGNIVEIGTSLVQAVMAAMPQGADDEGEAEADAGEDDDPTSPPTG